MKNEEKENGPQLLGLWSKSLKFWAELVNNAENGINQFYQRYHNHLDSSIINTEWTSEEE